MKVIVCGSYGFLKLFAALADSALHDHVDLGHHVMSCFRASSAAIAVVTGLLSSPFLHLHIHIQIDDDCCWPSPNIPRER